MEGVPEADTELVPESDPNPVLEPLGEIVPELVWLAVPEGL